MLLAAENNQIGACWVMHFNPVAMRETFGIPEHIQPLALLVMGYAADDAKPLDLHEQFRPMDETVCYNHFN